MRLLIGFSFTLFIFAGLWGLGMLETQGDTLSSLLFPTVFYAGYGLRCSILGE
jgi:hypothetical protein